MKLLSWQQRTLSLHSSRTRIWPDFIVDQLIYRKHSLLLRLTMTLHCRSEASSRAQAYISSGEDSLRCSIELCSAGGMSCETDVTDMSMCGHKA